MAAGKKNGNGNSKQKQAGDIFDKQNRVITGDLGTFFDRQNRMITIVGVAGLVVAIAVGFIFYQVGRSDAVQEAEEQGYEKGIARGISQGLKAVAENQTLTIEDKFAEILKEAESAAEKRGFERGFKEGERVGLEKGKKLGLEEKD